MRCLHSYSAADDAAKESFSGLVLRLKSCSVLFFYFFSHKNMHTWYVACPYE